MFLLSKTVASLDLATIFLFCFLGLAALTILDCSTLVVLALLPQPILGFLTMSALPVKIGDRKIGIETINPNWRPCLVCISSLNFLKAWLFSSLCLLQTHMCCWHDWFWQEYLDFPLTWIWHCNMWSLSFGFQMYSGSWQNKQSLFIIAICSLSSTDMATYLGHPVGKLWTWPS